MKNILASGIYVFLTLSATLNAQTDEIKEFCKVKFELSNKASKKLEKSEPIYKLLVMDDYEDDDWAIYEYGYWSGQRQAYLKVMALISDAYQD